MQGQSRRFGHGQIRVDRAEDRRHDGEHRDTVVFLHPAEGLHGDLGMLARHDVLIAISNSGETQEILQLLPFMERMGIPVVAIVGRMSSTLAKNSAVSLDVSVAEEACPMGLAPTASTTATLAMGDALAVALLEKRGFKEQDFAQFHPGGTLGRRLLVKVRDLMHKGQDVPQVEETVLASVAILEMSAKKLGMTTVVDRAGALLGVITDGDLRRFVQQGGDFSKISAGSLASRRPKLIRTGRAGSQSGRNDGAVFHYHARRRGQRQANLSGSCICMIC